jgi:hypothetical protein
MQWIYIIIVPSVPQAHMAIHKAISHVQFAFFVLQVHTTHGQAGIRPKLVRPVPWELITLRLVAAPLQHVLHALQERTILPWAAVLPHLACFAHRALIVQLVNLYVPRYQLLSVFTPYRHSLVIRSP